MKVPVAVPDIHVLGWTLSIVVCVSVFVGWLLVPGAVENGRARLLAADFPTVFTQAEAFPEVDGEGEVER